MALDGEGPPSLPLVLSRICEEFGDCLPSVAYRELLTLPVGLMEELLEARAFAQAKALLDAAKSSKDYPKKSRMFEAAKRVKFELAQAEIDRKKQRRKE